MLTITGNGNLTRTPELRITTSGKKVTTVSVASTGRNRDDEPYYIDLILWENQAQAAVDHLIKGQSVAFSGRPEVRVYSRKSGEPGATLELHGVDIEYGGKSRRADESATDSNREEAVEQL